jgi:multimeric flavodoxin WrbA
MNNEVLIILGSARKQGHTQEYIESIFENIPHRVIYLNDYHISPYRYDTIYDEGDQFLAVMNLVSQYEIIVFATPVYWYAMSGMMKTFFDRLTELTDIYKPLGKGLKGKQTFLVAVGTDTDIPEGFEVPFKLTSLYFEMSYKGCVYRSTKLPLTNASIQAAKTRFLSMIEA